MSIVENACRLHILPERLCAGQYQEDPDIASLIRHIARRIPTLTDLQNYESRLSWPVSTALTFAKKLAAQVGTPKALDMELWTKDPFIPVLFDSPDEGNQVLRRSAKIHDVFKDDNVEKCFFLMTMDRHEFEIRGSELDGDIIKQDVTQTIVCFESHTVTLAAPTKEQAMEEMARNIVYYLAELTPERLRKADVMRDELRRSETVLKAQLHTLAQASREQDQHEVAPGVHEKLAEGQKEAKLFADKLKNMPPNPDPKKFLGLVREVLLHPEKHLIIDDVRMQVEDYGVKTSSGKGREIQFVEFKAWGVKSMAILFATLSRESAMKLWPQLNDKD